MGWSPMVSRWAAVSSCLLLLGVVLFCVSSSSDATPDGEATKRKEDDQKVLDGVRLPPDPRRLPDEKYFQRFVIRTEQGQTFVGAYWREQGSFVLLAVDIFAIEKSQNRLVGRRIYSGGLGEKVLSLQISDFDRDGRDDLIFITRGGMLVHVIALQQTAKGFSEVFRNAGSDVLVYRDGKQVRIMVKAKISKKVDEFSWNPSKRTFELTRTLDLLY